MPTPSTSPSTASELTALLEHPGVWRGDSHRLDQQQCQNYPATGFEALDCSLPGGGWPQGALTEILCDGNGLGELSLLLPALTQLNQGPALLPKTKLAEEKRWLAFIAPPYLPYAPAFKAQGIDLSRVLLVFPPVVPGKLSETDSSCDEARPGSQPPQADACWAIEQALRSGTCAAVLAWPKQVAERQLRRLQLAAEEGQSWGILFRGKNSARTASPAALRLKLEAGETGTRVEVFKCRGGRGFGPVEIPPFRS